MPNTQPLATLAGELLSIRQQLQAALTRCDRLLAGQPGSGAAADWQTLQVRYRVSPGGALSAGGVLEIRRRFEAGETNSLIAREMGIAVQGVAKRRTDFNTVRGASPRKPGALKGRIKMTSDFDELSPQDQAAMEEVEE